MIEPVITTVVAALGGVIASSIADLLRKRFKDRHQDITLKRINDDVEITLHGNVSSEQLHEKIKGFLADK